MRTDKPTPLYLPSRIFIALFSLALAACSIPPQATDPVSDYALSVDLKPSDTARGLEQQYGGRVVVWNPQAGYAVLGLDKPQAERLNAGAGVQRLGLALEPNQGAFKVKDQMVDGNGLSIWAGGNLSLWAGGSLSLWAGGNLSLWAGGNLSLWAGGQYSLLPENSDDWSFVQLQQAQALAPNLGANVKVAVIDSGIDLGHPAFQGALVPADQMWDFVGNDPLPQEEGSLGMSGYGHGSIIAGVVLQVAPGAKIMPLRVLGPDGSVTAVASAIDWAVSRGAQVINLSLGSDKKSSAIAKSINAAIAKGIYVVASVGNSGTMGITYPASDAHLGSDDLDGLWLSVGSVNLQGVKSGFSNYGSALELMAPGENIYGPAPEGRMASWSGTSVAVPVVSGALALGLGERKSKLGDRLMATTQPLDSIALNASYRENLGRGAVQLANYLNQSSGWYKTAGDK